MGFRNGAYMTVWEIKPVKDTVTDARVSCSRKNKMTGEYEEDFSGFVKFCGTACVNKALSLRPRDRIKLGDVEVKRRRDNKKTKEIIDQFDEIIREAFAYDQAKQDEIMAMVKKYVSVEYVDNIIWSFEKLDNSEPKFNSEPMPDIDGGYDDSNSPGLPF